MEHNHRGLEDHFLSKLEILYVPCGASSVSKAAASLGLTV